MSGHWSARVAQLGLELKLASFVMGDLHLAKARVSGAEIELGMDTNTRGERRTGAPAPGRQWADWA